MWRQTDDRKVWYEWIVDVYTHVTEMVADAKTGGRSVERVRKVRIGGSELHSSEKEACLM
jgi:protein arginine N-methyltransferase 5